MARVTAATAETESAQPASSEYPTQQSAQLSASMPKYKGAWIAACGNPAAYEFVIVRCPIDPLSRSLTKAEVAQYRLAKVPAAPRPTAALCASWNIASQDKAAKAAGVRAVGKAAWLPGANKGNRWAVFCWSESGQTIFQYVVPVSRREDSVLSSYQGTALSRAAMRDVAPVGLSAEEKAAASAPRQNATIKVKAPSKPAQSAKASEPVSVAPEAKASAQDKIRARMAAAAEARQSQIASGNGATILVPASMPVIEVGTIVEGAASAQEAINSEV